ncbi:MAG: hypothetical protein Q3996_01295 [Candidatus Saccharibacteria bacterium]|nr:hypothetical protein [Candidatus Saccharibacteria bacterium]
MGTGYSIFSDEDDIRRELKQINEKLDDIRDLMQEVSRQSRNYYARLRLQCAKPSTIINS